MFAAPVAAAAQQAGKVWRIGLLGIDDPSSRPFVQGLQNLGWIEGQNIALDRRFSPNCDRLAALARDLVRLHVDVIVAANAPSTRAPAAATQTIPIVMAPTGDPVSAGFVSSLAPGHIFLPGDDDVIGPRLQQLGSLVGLARRGDRR